MITTFDLGKPDSPYYDESQAPVLESFMSQFKGVKIVSTSPLTIETYDDSYALDAENTAIAWTWYPSYLEGEAPWHTLALGLMSEQAGESAFSPDKAAAAKIEQTSFLAGPTLETLKGELDKATADPTTLPYGDALGVDKDEATTRFANLSAFFGSYGHFWVGSGPYFISQVFPVEKTITLKNYDNYPDTADRYLQYSEAPIPDVTLDGPSTLTIGDKATFTATVTFNDEPYAKEDISKVLYLVYDAEGNLVMQGEGTGGDDGTWTVEFDTTDLPEGSNRVEVVVISKKVGVPVFASQEFVTSK